MRKAASRLAEDDVVEGEGVLQVGHEGELIEDADVVAKVVDALLRQDLVACDLVGDRVEALGLGEEGLELEGRIPVVSGEAEGGGGDGLADARARLGLVVLDDRLRGCRACTGPRRGRSRGARGSCV